MENLILKLPSNRNPKKVIKIYENDKCLGRLVDFVNDKNTYQMFLMRLFRNDYNPIEIEYNNFTYILKPF